MSDYSPKALEDLAEFGKIYEDELKSYDQENDDWWDALSQEGREHAFYAVVKRIFQGEIVDRGTYRYVLYDVFGFDGSMYGRGMSCGFMALHNSIYTDEEIQKFRDRELAAAGIKVETTTVELKND